MYEAYDSTLLRCLLPPVAAFLGVFAAFLPTAGVFAIFKESVNNFQKEKNKKGADE